MSRSATMSILTIAGLYDYDDTLFDYMDVPEDVDKDTAIAYILMLCQELEILYPSAPVMKKAIKYWSSAESPIWQKVVATHNLEYNPLENYDVYDERHEAFNRGDSRDRTVSSTNQSNVHDESIDSRSGQNSESTSGASTNIHKVSAFNETTAQLANEDIENHSSQSSGTDSENYNKNRTVTDNSTSNDSTNENLIRNESDNSNGHTHGNMGSYSFQELIAAEQEVNEFNIYQYIAERFRSRFCLLVY